MKLWGTSQIEENIRTVEYVNKYISQKRNWNFNNVNFTQVKTGDTLEGEISEGITTYLKQDMGRRKG